MALETATYINDLVTTNPTSTDPKSQGDDHIRLVKSAIRATLPNLAGPVTVTETDINTLANASSSGASGFNVVTQSVGNSSTLAASTAFVAATAFTSALPAQTGNQTKFITTDGSTARWAVAVGDSLYKFNMLGGF